MNKFIEILEKMNPFFTKVSNNKYLKSVMNGFMSIMYITLFSSVFMIVNNVPNAWGFYWPEAISAILMKPYDLSMGLLGLFLAGAIAKALADEMNRELPNDKKLSIIPIFIASMVSFMILTVEFVEGGISVAHFGSSGIFVAMITSFVTVNIYKICKLKNITIKLPAAVPPNISDSFADVFSFSFSVIFFVILDTIIRSVSDANIATTIMQLLAPVFNVGDTYLGAFFLMSSISVLTYMGVHGTSVVMSVVAPVMMVNFAANQAALQAGLVPAESLTTGMIYSSLMGGSGATLMVCFMFAFLAKSKANKAVGKAAFIPTNFMINEPILFGGPILMNPYFLIPYIIVPGLNAVLYKVFIDVLGMSGAILSLGLGVPMVASLPISHSFHPLSFVLLFLILILDFVIYYPFFKSFDIKKVKEELNRIDSIDDVKVETDYSEFKNNNKGKDSLNVLVLCIMGGTSGMLSNSINKGAEELGLNINSKAAQASSVIFSEMGDLDLVVLAPQAKSEFNRMNEELTKMGIALSTTDGPEYIKLGQNPDLAVDYVINLLKDK